MPQIWNFNEELKRCRSIVHGKEWEDDLSKSVTIFLFHCFFLLPQPNSTWVVPWDGCEFTWDQVQDFPASFFSLYCQELVRGCTEWQLKGGVQKEEDGSGLAPYTLKWLNLIKGLHLVLSKPILLSLSFLLTANYFTSPSPLSSFDSLNPTTYTFLSSTI